MLNVFVKKRTAELKVGEWFLIDRDVIRKSKEEIHSKCNEVGADGKALWERFEKSNKIADENPNQYPRLIETYIFEHSWKNKTEREMREMCEDVGDGMCDEVIYDFELQMRICNGEPVDELLIKPDKLPRIRVIKFRNGDNGYAGGSTDLKVNDPPAYIFRIWFLPDGDIGDYTPYAFRRRTLQ